MVQMLHWLIAPLIVAAAAPVPAPDDVATLELIDDSFSQPLYVTAPDGDDRIFVVEKAGRVRLVINDRIAGTYLDIRPLLPASIGGEQGLLGMAFHPDFATNGLLYLSYTDTAGAVVVAEVTVDPDANSVGVGNRNTVIRVPQPARNHNGGMMQFGPDWYLYASIGDGGADPPTVPVGRYGQTLGDVFGTIIRIDPRADAPYGIPPDNPFVSVEGARPEIVAYGLRNPWRFAIDAKTKTMLIADVGEGAREEVDRLPLDRLGLNFGWPCKEGSIVPPKVDIPESCTGARLTPPLFEYPHGEKRCSITGGVVARAPNLRALDGLYLWADFCEGRVNALTAAGNVVPLNLRAEQPTSFGLDGTGRIYVTTATGTLLRLDIGDRA